MRRNDGISIQTPLSRRGVLATGVAALAGLASRSNAATVVPQGKLTLAWHTNIAARWLDPQQHDGTASPDNFLMALHDGLIKNFRDELYDHPALAERYRVRRGRQERDVLAAARAPSSMTARRSRRRT